MTSFGSSGRASSNARVEQVDAEGCLEGLFGVATIALIAVLAVLVLLV